MDLFSHLTNVKIILGLCKFMEERGDIAMRQEDRENLAELKVLLLRLPIRRWGAACWRSISHFILSCIIFELILLFFHFDLLGILSQYIPILANPILTGVASLAAIVSAVRTGHSSDVSSKKEGDSTQPSPNACAVSGSQRHPKRTRKKRPETMCARAWNFLLPVLGRMWRSGPFSLFMLLFIWVLAPSCVAHYTPCSYLIVSVMDACEQAVTNRSHQLEESPAVADPEPLDGKDRPESDDVSDPINQQTGFLEHPDTLWRLSGEKYDQVYFQTPEYLIENWSNQDEVTDTVVRLVGELRALAAPNVFDTQAPYTLEQEVFHANTSYDQMTSSIQLDETIDIHLRAWEYPKYDIAKLLAYEYQKYALEYDKVDGPFETIEYYCGLSILWAHQAITFASATDDQVKTFLFYISYRYHDIADAAPYGSMTQIKATMLCKAYDTARNLEFYVD